MGENYEGGANASPDFVIRDLKATDVWQMVRILSKLDLRDAKKAIDLNLYKKAQFKTPEMLGDDGQLVPLPREKWTKAQLEAEMEAQAANDELLWQMLGFLMENIVNCERDINKLLGDGIGLTPEQVAQLDADVYMNLIMQFVTREEFSDFFTQAWRLLEGRNLKKSSGDAMRMLMSS